MRKRLTAAIFTSALVALAGAQAYAQSALKDLSLPEVWQGGKETVFGTLQFDHGMPTKESADTLYAKLDANRATELYLWSLPIVSNAQWREQMKEKHPGATRTAR